MLDYTRREASHEVEDAKCDEDVDKQSTLFVTLG
jgi:hypothetical protein